MKLFMTFSPSFYRWALAIARELNNRDPGTIVSGIVAAEQHVFKRVAASQDPVISPIVRLDDLERKWLNTPCHEERMSEYEVVLGPGIVRRLLVADRQLGTGLVSGGLWPRTDLIEIAEDFEIVRRYIFGLLDYVFDTLDEIRPDLVFTPGIAGALPLAIAFVCRHLMIPYVRFASVRIDSRVTIDDSFETKLAPVRRKFELALKDPSTLQHVLPAAREYMDRFRSKPEKPDYALFSHRRAVEAHSAINIAKRTLSDLRGVASTLVRRPHRDLRRPTAMQLMKFNLAVQLRARRDQKFGTFKQSKDLPGRPFAYFPLHVDPEASTMVLSPMHTDQLAILEALAKSLPLGLDLIAKEHPPMLGRRPKGFYRRLKRMPGVILLSPSEDSLRLIERARLVCVITGTAAWEAMLLKQPALFIGDSPFLALGKGFVHCPDISRLPEGVARALTVPPADDERLALFIAALLDQSFDFPAQARWGRVTNAFVESNREILINICDKLEAFAKIQ